MKATVALVALAIVASGCGGAASTTPPTSLSSSSPSPTTGATSTSSGPPAASTSVAPTPTPGRTAAPTASASPTPSPSDTPSPSGAADGVDALIRDLKTAGARVVSKSDAFDATPLAAEGLTVCVDGQDIKVYTYASHEQAIAGARQISPTDPTHIGASIVEWDGAPKFWGRDRIIVLYLGIHDELTALLSSVLGPPFSHGLVRPPRLPGPC